MSRRTVLRAAGIGGLVVAGGLLWRADRQGVFSPESGAAFDAWKTDPDGVQALAAAAVLAASPHNIQNWVLGLAADRADLLDDTARGLGLVDPFRREAHLGLGCAVANIEIAGPAHGYTVTTTLLPDLDPAATATDSTGDGRAATFALAAREPDRSDRRYAAIRARHSDRGGFPTGAPDRDLLDTFAAEALAGGTGVEIRWVTTPDGLDSTGQLLVDAAQALVDDEPMSIDNAGWMRYSPQAIAKHEDGLTLDAQALPKLVELAAKMLPAVSRQQGDSSWVHSTRDVHTATARAYGLVLAPRHDVRARLEAGRAMQRLHLGLTAEGWAMHHMNQAVELAEREEATGRDPVFTDRLAAAAGGHEVIAMLRTGRPSGRAVPSPRRPWTTVTADAASVLAG